MIEEKEFCAYFVEVFSFFIKISDILLGGKSKYTKTTKSCLIEPRKTFFLTER